MIILIVIAEKYLLNSVTIYDFKENPNNKPVREGNFYNMIKNIFESFIAKIKYNGEKWTPFALDQQQNKDCSHLFSPPPHCSRDPSNVIGQEKETKRIKFERDEIKLSFFSGSPTVRKISKVTCKTTMN